MNKAQGVTAGAIVAAGLLLRPIASVSPIPVAPHGSGPSLTSSEAGKTSEEGPWLASCKYWEPVRGVPPESKDQIAIVSISIKEEGGKVDSKTTATAKEESSKCPVTKGSTRWGIPNGSGGINPAIHAIIASVPDPLHTHLGLDFDRDIDALVQAAGDNGYVPSYFWLPWKNHAASLRTEESAGGEHSGENSARDRQPGLIIFKRVPESKPESDSVDLQSNYFDVIYLFVVGETPVLGMDGAQLSNAFGYEAELFSFVTKIGGASFAFSLKPGNNLSIIAPSNSGSAASLREGIEASLLKFPLILGKLNVEITGGTQTMLASDLLSKPADRNTQQKNVASPVHYISFAENSAFETRQFLFTLACSGYHLDRVAILSEDSTVFGDQGNHEIVKQSPGEPPNFTKLEDACPQAKDWENGASGYPLRIRFPRDISLLRNAHTNASDEQENQGKAAPTPFLHLSLRDPGANDSVPQFSPDQMPLSQEAQLMSISRLLQNARSQFILINASNVLDRLFLAQFLHRACPEARLVFVAGDLLFGRETENTPYIGTITLSAYNLLNPVLTTNQTGQVGAIRAFADSATEAYFNAASFSFWDGQPKHLRLANYLDSSQGGSSLSAYLWATVIGSDGYYPLGIVNDCASDSPNILPRIDARNAAVVITKCTDHVTPPTSLVRPDEDFATRVGWLLHLSNPHDASLPYRYPALSWEVLCALVGLICIAHGLAITFPRYWSPWTRDLAIDQGDEGPRRAMYIFIATVMLYCMAFATAYPVIPSFRMVHPNWHTLFCCLVTLGAANGALIATLRKVGWYLGSLSLDPSITTGTGKVERTRLWLNKNATFLFNVIATLTLLTFPGLWIWICYADAAGGRYSYVGPFFSYRCLFPGSGISPMVPVLLILLGWYLWAVFQTLRLRFSEMNRPRLPGPVSGKYSWPLFVSDSSITECDREANCCLTSNITCLLITREIVRRLFPKSKWWPTLGLISVYLSLFLILIFGLRFGSVDRFLWQTGALPTPYEFLISALAFPLAMIALSGWLRAMLIWSSLKRGLLEPLEQFPIRYAFTRLKGIGWMNMMRQGGLVEQWRDMARSTESMRQIVHDRELKDSFCLHHESQWKQLEKIQNDLDDHIAQIILAVGAKDDDLISASLKTPHAGLMLMAAIESCYAKACEALLGGILIPYWEDKRVGLVEGEKPSDLPINARTVRKEETGSRSHTQLQLHTHVVAEEPMYIWVAEEFLVIRYVSLIRAVMVNMRRLLLFISTVFVLMIVAWNSYPFQPRQWIDEAFTALFFLLGAGIIWVFAQMHRNPVLSRITDTNANELGFEFYLRVLTFGAVPVLTWLAYQFPEIGSGLFKLIQPGLEVIK